MPIDICTDTHACRDVITRHKKTDPNPLFDNTKDAFFQRSDRILLDSALDLGFLNAPFGQGSGLKIKPDDGEGHNISLVKGSQVLGKEPISVENIRSFHHNIGIEIGNYKIQVLEHLLGVLQGCNIVNTDIEIDVSQFRKQLFEKSYWGSVPMNPSDLSEKLLQNSKELETQREVYTFDKRYSLTFDSTSYMVLEPGEDDLIFDIHIDYPTPGIGSQRVVFNIADLKNLQQYVFDARTGSYKVNLRKFAIDYLDNPICRNIIGSTSGLRNQIPTQLGDNAYVIHNSDIGLYNRDENYDVDGRNLEIIYHEILDKLAIFGINPFSDKKMTGTIYYNRVSHDNDLSMLAAVESGDIVLQKV